MSLRLKLVSLLAAVALVPLGASAWTSLRLHNRALEQQLTELHARLAESAARLTQRQLEDGMQRLRLAAASVRWADLSEGERQGAVWLVYRQLEDGAVTALLDGDGRGVGPSAYVASDTGGELAQHPRASLEALRAFAASIPFEQAQSRGAALGAAFTAPDAEARLVPLAVALDAPRGRPWVIVTALSLRTVCRDVARLGAGSVSVDLVDASGQSLCRRASERPARDATATVLAATATPRTFTYTRDAAAMLATQVPLANGWMAVAEVPAAVAYAVSDRMRAQSVAWILVSLAAALGSGLVLANSLSRRVRALVEGAQELASGNLGRRLDTRGSDEIARLSAQFNHMRDMVEKRELEIRAWNAELSERVAQRTRELKEAQDELLESRKMAAVTTLGAGVAHEINNPLASVLGLVELLRSSPRLPARDRDQTLAAIDAAARRIQKIVETFVAFSRDLGEGFAPLSVREVVEGALELLSGELSMQGVRLDLRIEEPLPPILGNRSELQQALVHIIENARLAMPGGGALSVSARAIEGGLVRIEVADSGRGIPREDLDKIFEPFFTTKQGNWRGEGLGLTVTYQIITAHHGKVRAESTVGQGTTVTVLLPPAPRSAHLE